MSRKLRGTLCLFALTAIAMGDADAQVPDTPQTRLRPISSNGMTAGPPTQTRQFRETDYQQNATPQPGQYPVRQTAMLQQFEPPPLNNSGPMALPGNFGSLPAVAPPVTPALPPSAAPRGLPTGPVNGGPVNGGPVNGGPVNGGNFNNQNLAPVPMAPSTVPSSSDMSPIAQPQLNDGFATINNCNCISPPSSYVSTMYGDCAPVSYQQPQAGVPAQVQVLPPNVAPTGVVAPPAAAPAGSLVTFGQRALPIQVAPGLYGQPVAYVQGQRFRNWIRYIFP